MFEKFSLNLNLEAQIIIIWKAQTIHQTNIFYEICFTYHVITVCFI